MSKTTLTPYLILNGRAREAAAFYAKALSGTVTRINTFGEGNQGCAEALKERIMHAEVVFNDVTLMMADGLVDDVKPHNMVNVALDIADVAELRRAYDALAVGGQPVEKLFKAPWGGMFGMVRDPYGIDWMMTSSNQD